MPEHTIFFSYSRQDSDFALNLAKDLRMSGADIWIDKLDIPPGAHWDQAVEEGLRSADTVLVILSKSSVASGNVMDEISLALDEGKTIVPALIEECEIPFRIKRLQYADFTGEYPEGAKSLVNALDLDPTVANRMISTSEVTDPKKAPTVATETVDKTTAPSPPKKKEPSAPRPSSTDSGKSAPAPKPAPEPAPNPAPSPQPDDSKKSGNKTKPILITVVVAVLIALGVWLLPGLLKDKDTEAYNLAKTEHTIPAYDSYLEAFPEGKWREEANEAIRAIDLELIREAEEAAWAEATEADDIIEYEIYLKEYEDGTYAAEARQRIDELYDLEDDERRWEEALEDDTVEAYVDYIVSLASKGSHHDEAVMKVKSMLNTAGWAYYGEMVSEDEMEEGRFFDRVEGSSDAHPEMGDLIRVKIASGVTVRRRADQDSGNIGGVRQGQIAEITDVTAEGDHYWVRIEY